MEGMDIAKHLETCSFSSSKTVALPSFGCQNVLPAASCAKDDHSVGQEKAADAYSWKKHVEEQVAGEKQKQQSGQFGNRISFNLGETHSEREMPQSESLGSSTCEGYLKCNHCGKDFKRKSVLLKHVRVHTGDPPYKCSQCGKSFTQSGHLTSHLRTRSGDGPYKCSQCGKSYTESSSLTNHMHIHTGDRPYKCSQCGNSFTVSDSLSNHMHTHTGDRPYKSFKQRGHLSGHMHKRTEEQPLN